MQTWQARKLLAGSTAVISPAKLPPIPNLQTERIPSAPAGIATQHAIHEVHGRRPGCSGVLLTQYISKLGGVYNLGTHDRKSARFVPKPELIRRLFSQSIEYKQQQDAYLAKMRKLLTPRPLSEELKEFDSTKDNPPNSQSARFGLKPETEVYTYRIISWGEAGSGIPLANNPYSVRPQEAPRVDAGLKRKKFSHGQRETVRDARYKQVVEDILKARLHNSHALASRFLGPETSANISPATFTNHKDKQWGQGEMQSHLENALFRIENTAGRDGTLIFLRCTDYLGKFGELQSRKIKIFLSEPVADKELLASRGTVKETILGTFYLPGMLKEPESGAFISEFKNQVKRLEQAVEVVVNGNHDVDASRPPLEMRYKYGICAQKLKSVGHQKLVHGKIHRTNDGLGTVLQCAPKNHLIRGSSQEAPKKTRLTSGSQSNNAVFDALEKMNANPRILKRGEEIWNMDEVEVVLGHIRRPDLDNHIQVQFDAGQLSLKDASSFHSLGLSRSSSESSNSSFETTKSDAAKSIGTTVDWEFEIAQELCGSFDAVASNASFSGSTSSSPRSDSHGGLASGPAWTSSWLEIPSKKSRGPQP